MRSRLDNRRNKINNFLKNKRLRNFSLIKSSGSDASNFGLLLSLPREKSLNEAYNNYQQQKNIQQNKPNLSVTLSSLFGNIESKNKTQQIKLNVRAPTEMNTFDNMLKTFTEGKQQCLITKQNKCK